MLTIELVGGLGNQLFGYTVGRAIEQSTQIPVRFDLSRIDRDFSAHGASLENRKLAGDFGRWSDSPFARSLSLFSIWAQKNFPSLQEPLCKILGSYRSPEVGWDHRVLTATSRGLVRGYFQSWRYFHSLRQGTFTSRDLILKSGGSAWFRDMAEEITTVKPIVVHVRRGDYLRLRSEFGLVGVDYYKSALDVLLDQLGSRPIYVFSDSPEIAKSEFSKIQGGLLFVDPPKSSEPAESIVLMSNASAHVLSNSTFAFWGALLNENNPVVIAPNPWFRGLPDPIDLLKPSWIALDHAF